jgi:hypothetical protein
VIAIGDGALGFWAALRDVWPETREQRDWMHKVANVLDALPKSVQRTAKKLLAEMRDAEDRDHAVAAAKRVDTEFRSKWPKAADKLRDDPDRLLTFFDIPAEHWLHRKTPNPIESTFSTVRSPKGDQGSWLRERQAWPWGSSSSSPPRTAGERRARRLPAWDDPTGELDIAVDELIDQAMKQTSSPSGQNPSPMTNITADWRYRHLPAAWSPGDTLGVAPGLEASTHMGVANGQG